MKNIKEHLNEIEFINNRTICAVLNFLDIKKIDKNRGITKEDIVKLVTETIRNESIKNMQVNIDDLIENLIKLNLIEKISHDNTYAVKA